MNSQTPSIFRKAQRLTGLACAMITASVHTPIARAGGGPENALIIADPGSDESLYIANYYKHARNIPDRNVIYLDPEADNYTGFVDFHLSAFLGSVTTRAIDDHIDYVIIPPGSGYRIPAPGLISDSCSSVSKFAIASTYTMAHIVDDILAGDSEQRRNEYSTPTDEAIAFDSNTSWFFGQPSTTSSARRYFIGAMLGYTGLRGNTIAEITDMIDRSVTVDGTHPAGTFYYIQTTDVARSGPREDFFPSAVQAIQSYGGAAEHLGDGQQNVVLPTGRHDCLGVMTGWANPDVINADMTLLPGSFCDHLTSFAGYFDAADQTKMSDWITKGASGSAGTVEEPCNFPGKFPHPGMHVFYYQGLSLGEATFRSLGYVPYQVLVYGDPLTRPFAHIPDVQVAGAPAGEVSGLVTLTPSASTTAPGAQVDEFHLLIDGVFRASVVTGQSFTIDTTTLADGHHELRVIGFENTPIATQGRWISQLTVNNTIHTAAVTAAPTTGDLATIFDVSVSAAGGNVSEIRLMQNGRVLAAAATTPTTFPISARRLGAGMVRLIAVADFDDGSRAFSHPITLDISFTETPPSPPNGNTAPVAHNYNTLAIPGVPTILDLPATDADGDMLTLTVNAQPAQATLTPGANAFLLAPNESATGSDVVTFTASDGQSGSVGQVTIHYCGFPTITNQPADQETCTGDSAVFQVTAVGSDLSFQWLRNDIPIAGATQSTYGIDNVQPLDAGLYAVDVTSHCGDITDTVRSQSAALVIPTNVVFTVQPQGDTLCLGEAWFAFASATGADTFQWFKDGQAIPDATASFLILSSVTPSDRGTYVLEASNSCAVTPSDPAELGVVGCGDGDSDGDTDFVDFSLFQSCFTGPTPPSLPDSCAPYDFDGDADLDLTDYQSFLDIATPPTE